MAPRKPHPSRSPSAQREARDDRAAPSGSSVAGETEPIAKLGPSGPAAGSDSSSQPATDAARPDAASERAIERFVEAWGRMGSVWGISRTMAEVHALLYITGEAMCTDDVMARLQISRGNASMSLRALLDWGIVSRVHRRGDRKEYYQADLDVWSIFRSIVRERLKREVDPLLVALHEIRDEERAAQSTRDARGKDNAREAARDLDERLDSMIEFLELGSGLADKFIGPSGPGLRLAASIASKAANFAGGFGRGGRATARGFSADLADEFETPIDEVDLQPDRPRGPADGDPPSQRGANR